MKAKLPEIVSRKAVAESRFFKVEEIELHFSNGEQRLYERMAGSGRGAVMVVPMLDAETMLLVREYCAGTHSYELGFPKGLIDPGENAVSAANRELKEEIGYGANNFHLLRSVIMAPAFFNAKMDIYLAENLFEEKLPGDEPEPLEVVPWKLSDYKRLLTCENFNEARSVAALMLAVEKLRGQ